MSMQIQKFNPQKEMALHCALLEAQIDANGIGHITGGYAPLEGAEIPVDCIGKLGAAIVVIKVDRHEGINHLRVVNPDHAPIM